MRHLALAALPIALSAALAGCGGRATEETTRTVTKDGVTTTTITTREVGHGDKATARAGTSGLSIDSDKFKANFDIPGLTFGGDSVDLDGMKLYPGSTVKGMHVHAVDRPGTEKGEVVIDFTSPAAPAVVAQHMAEEAKRAGFTLAVNSAAQVGGSRVEGGDTHRFAVTFNANGDGTVGQLSMTGTKQ